MYFRSKTHCFPINTRTGSNSLCAGIVARDNPCAMDMVIDPSPYVYRNYVDHVDVPNLPCLMLFREPIEKVRSTLAMSDVDPELPIVDNLIAHLQAGTDFSEAIYYRKQVDLIAHAEAAGQTIKVYAFPTQIEAFCAEAGLHYPLPVLNETSYPKRDLTAEQLAFFTDYFAADIAYYNNLVK